MRFASISKHSLDMMRMKQAFFFKTPKPKSEWDCLCPPICDGWMTHQQIMAQT